MKNTKNSIFDGKCSAYEFRLHLEQVYYNQKSKGDKMIWIVTLQDDSKVEVPNSEIGNFISNNKAVKAELKEKG